MNNPTPYYIDRIALLAAADRTGRFAVMRARMSWWIVSGSIACALGACFKVDTPHFGEGATVEGDVSGVWTGASVQLRLVSDDIDETVTIDADGAFAFVALVAEGSDYEVTVAEQPDVHACTVTDGTGVLVVDAVPRVGVQCVGPSVEVDISAPIDWAFNPAVLAHDVDVSVLIQEIEVTVTSPDATEIWWSDIPIGSGQILSPFQLALGPNPFELEVHVGDLSRVFELTFDRGAAVAEQYVYGKASNTDPGDQFGFVVAASGDTIVVGAYGESSAATGINGDQGNQGLADDSGAVYVFRRSGSVWAQEAYIKASNTDGGDYFGWSVAIDGDTLVVGAPFEDSTATGVNGSQNDNGSDPGAAYVFRRNGSTWAQEAYVKASNTGAGDFFGASVAVDGDRLVVGAIYEDSNAVGVGGNQANETANDSGAVYVYSRSGVTWTQDAYVKASSTGFVGFFGNGVSLSGNTLAVGAPLESSNATGIDGQQNNNLEPSSGAVYVFVRGATTWTQQAYAKASNTDAEDGFGTSVSFSANRLVVGAPREDGVAARSGAAYVFQRTGTQWAQEEYLKASNAGADDGFGFAVALVGDTVAIGAWSEGSSATGVDGDEDNDGALASGAAYLFRSDGSSWVREAYLKPSNTGAGDYFGNSVALSGTALVVGAPSEDGAAAGINGDDSSNAAQTSGSVYILR